MPQEFVKAVLLALSTVLIAIPLGHYGSPALGWTVFCLGLGLQIWLHFRNFKRLDRWSRNPIVDPTDQETGEWDSIFSRLYRHEKQHLTRIDQCEHEIEMLIAANQVLSDGIILLNHNHQIAFCNTTAESQLTLNSSRDKGQPITHLVRQPEFVDYMQAGNFEQPLVFRPERRAGLVLSLRVRPYAGNRSLLQITDITQTDRLDNMRRDFVANVSHELRTPLTVLAGFLETLQELDLSREEQNSYLALMAEQSRRMQSIVQDLLTLSSIESGPPPENERVDMARLMDKLHRDAMSLSAGRHEIVLEADRQGDLMGSEPELVSALGNLVANAVRYTPAGGRVHILWQISENGAVFAVEDTGIGIEAKHIPRLTERFYRVDRGRSRDAGGTGLGLAIVKHTLNRHQAKLEIKSTPGKGSRFTAHFPAARVQMN